MYLMRERRVDGISKAFGLRKWKDGVATNRNGGWAGDRGWNSLLDRLFLKFLLDIQVELLDIGQAGGYKKEFRKKV